VKQEAARVADRTASQQTI